MMRYRDATSRPGRNRPSFNKYSAELEGRELGGREDELRDDGGRGGSGDVAVASRSIVAMSSAPVFEAGLPQEEQKRTFSDKSVPQDEHLAIENFQLQSTADLGPQTSDFTYWNSAERGPRSEVRRPFCYHPKR
jgi:hypothetical protein